MPVPANQTQRRRFGFLCGGAGLAFNGADGDDFEMVCVLAGSSSNYPTFQSWMNGGRAWWKYGGQVSSIGSFIGWLSLVFPSIPLVFPTLVFRP
jgi:hypothetical protein